MTLIDKLLVPEKYRTWQIVLDEIFRIGLKKNHPEVFTREIKDRVRLSEEDLESALLFLVRADYLKPVGSDNVPSYSLTAKGQTSSFEQKISRIGFDNRFKNIQFHHTLLLIFLIFFNLFMLLKENSSEKQSAESETLRVEIEALSQRLDSMDLKYTMLRQEGVGSESDAMRTDSVSK